MPESKSQQVLHSNEEVTNFRAFGDARVPAWLYQHPADRDRALSRLQNRPAAVGSVTPGSLTPIVASANSLRAPVELDT